MNVKSSFLHNKLNLLQVYRGIAALLVVLFHLTNHVNEKLDQTYLLNLFSSGWCGVDYFFVLSGFLMLYVHGSAIGKKEKLKEFLVKRFVRIYPIYWIVMIPVLIFLLTIPGLSGKDLSTSTIIDSLFLLPHRGEMILYVAWTLVYEVFFYLFFCIAIWFKPKYSLPILSALIGLTLLDYLKITQFPEESHWLSQIFGSMNLEFALGALVAYCILKFPELGQRRWTLFAFANIAYVTLALLASFNIFEVDRVVSFGIAATLLTMAATLVDLKSPFKIPSFLVYLGDASYSLFLIHAPFISMTAKMMNKAGLAFDNFFAPTFIFLVTVASGCILYSLVEKPLTVFLRKKVVGLLIKKSDSVSI